MSRFSIRQISNQLGTTVWVSGVSRSYNSRGDSTETYSAYPMSGTIVQVMTAEDDLVKEGTFQPHDVILFVPDDEAFLSSIKQDDYLTWSAKRYIIREIIANDGHYEMHAKKITDSV